MKAMIRALAAAPLGALAFAVFDPSKNEQMMAKLQAVADGMESMKQKQPEGPMMELFNKWGDELEKTLQEVKASNLSEDQKEEKLGAMMTTMNGWKQQLSEREQALTVEMQMHTASLMMAVLQNKMGASMDEQLKVLDDAEFKELEVSKFLKAHHTEEALVIQAAKWMDEHEKPLKEDKSPLAGVGNEMSGILSTMQDRVAKLKAKMDMEEAGQKEKETKFNNLVNGFDESEFMQKHKKMLQQMLKQQQRSFEKAHAMEKMELKILEDAVDAIQKRDLGRLEEDKDKLQKHMDKMEKAQRVKKQDFLHLMQETNEQYKAPGFTCEFCGAQCLSSCTTEKQWSYEKCMNYCVKLDPRP